MPFELELTGKGDPSHLGYIYIYIYIYIRCAGGLRQPIKKNAALSYCNYLTGEPKSVVF